jgi:hypothetical protein
VAVIRVGVAVQARGARLELLVARPELRDGRKAPVAHDFAARMVV